jgi:hypothetical protein
MDEIGIIIKCIDDISSKTGIETKNWKIYDYDFFQEEVYKKSGILISVKTLNRIFAIKEKNSNYNPQIETKNALVKYLGYENWVQYKQKKLENYLSEKPLERQLPEPINNTSKKRLRLIFIISSVFMLAMASIYALTNISQNEEEFSFEGKYKEGYFPFTEVFNYDFSKIEDSVFIDEIIHGYLHHDYIPRDKKTYTMVFKEANFYKIQIKTKDRVLTTKDVYVKAKEWRYQISRKNYWSEESKEVVRKEGIATTHPISTHIKDSILFQTKFFYVDSIDGKMEDLYFETRIRNNELSNPYCNYTKIDIFGEEGNFQVHIPSPGCFGKSMVRISDQFYDGKFHDNSKLATSFAEWKTVSFLVKNYKMVIKIDGKNIFYSTYQKPAGKIKGLNITFNTTGEIDFVRFMNAAKDKPLYSEEFN